MTAHVGCPGFRFAGVRGGIKKKAGLDLGVIAADRPVATAAVFTSNRVKAAPVLLSQRALRAARGKVRGLVVNSGNANACTGPRGAADARRMQALAAAAIGCAPGEVLVASTGVIGEPLPMDRVETGISLAGAALTETGFAAFADAILTTDRRAKLARREVKLGGRTITLLGCTKGAGMIAPNMATTLTFVVTDAAIAPGALAAATRAAVAPTFNAIAVDGDTSTNDMLAVMASGRAGKAPLAGKALAAFTAALTELCADLARQLIGDGEGVHHVVTVQVKGATSARAATAVARRIATSPLVKTAFYGEDANWGRIIAAAGYSGEDIDADRMSLWFGGVHVFANGTPTAYAEQEATAAMKPRDVAVRLDLGLGDASATVWTCDFSHEYVTINGKYRT